MRKGWRKTKTEKNYDNVERLHCQGYSISEIAKKLKLSEIKVREHVLQFFRSM